MAFVPGFEFDIFISYSHLDNEAVDGEHWVEGFQDRLQVELCRREGTRDIKIWRDQKLDGNQKFEQTLQSRLEKSAILLCLNSRGYLHSDYCKKERDWFKTSHQDELVIGDRSRIFNVLLYNIPHTQWPGTFHGDSGFQFFQADPDDDGSPLESRDELFRDRIHRIAGALLATLRAMREARVKPARSKTEPANEARAAQKRPRLFFAKVSETLAKRRNFVIKELSRDFEILEPVPPPFENPAHDSAVEERIRQADLAIHLLNEFPGESIPGEATGYIQRQAEIARAARTAQFIWTPKSLVLGDESEPEDPDERAYRAFLGDVKARNRGDTNDFVQGMESEIVHEIRNSLDRRKAPTQPSPAAHPTVLLDFHAKDEDYFYDVYQFLDEHGIQPKLNRAADSGSNSLRFEKQLEQVSALIVFFGQVARDWVLERVLAAARITAIRRYPVKAFGIYLAPPRKTEGGLPDDWKPLTVYPLDNTGGFDPASFAPLLAQLGGAGTTKSHA